MTTGWESWGIIFRILLPHIGIKFKILFSFLQCLTNSLLEEKHDKINQRNKTVHLNTDLLLVVYTQLGVFISML